MERVPEFYPNPNPKLRVPEIAGTRKFGYEYGFYCWKPEIKKTQKTRPEISGKPERPVLVLVGGGVGGALIGVPLPANMGIAALLLVVSLLFSSLSLLIVAPVTIT
jgi:hypothetical protein